MLVVISIISGVALSLTFDATDPIIQQNKVDDLIKSLSDVLAADSFEEVDISTGSILKVYKGFDKEGKLVGLVVLSEQAGFQSYIKILTGIDIKSRKITKVKVLEHLETPGLGARIDEDEFLSQFQDKWLKEEVDGVTSATVATVDAITGATISSSTVIGTVGESLEGVLRLIKEENLLK